MFNLIKLSIIIFSPLILMDEQQYVLCVKKVLQRNLICTIFVFILGKIERSDWNVKEIEKKISENQFGRSSKGRAEKVPKWSREQYEDKVKKHILYCGI